MTLQEKSKSHTYESLAGILKTLIAIAGEYIAQNSSNSKHVHCAFILLNDSQQLLAEIEHSDKGGECIPGYLVEKQDYLARIGVSLIDEKLRVLDAKIKITNQILAECYSLTDAEIDETGKAVDFMALDDSFDLRRRTRH